MTKNTNHKIIEQWSSIPSKLIETFGDEGDFSRRYLLNPTLFSLLDDISGQAVLDAGCGNGYLARMLSNKGALVTALEPATPLFHYAINREKQEPLGIRYIQADLSTWRDECRFDWVIANMVLMDILDFEAALDTCFLHLKTGGQLLFSISHPCFEGSDSEFLENGRISTQEYFEHYAIEQTIGTRFHRPLSYYFQALLERGGSIRAVIEPQLDPAHAQHPLDNERNLHVPSFIVIQVSK